MIKKYEEGLFTSSLEDSPDVMSFWLAPILSTKKEQFVSFSPKKIVNRRESDLVLARHSISGLAFNLKPLLIELEEEDDSANITVESTKRLQLEARNP